MDHFLSLLSLLFLLATASHAAFPAQVYWDMILPNTTMPNGIRDLIRTDVLVDETTRTSSNAGKSTGDGKPDGGGICTVGHSQYKKAATDAEIHNNPCVTFFFLENQLHPGAKKILQIPRTPSDAAFIPRRAADSIPFSSQELPQILNRFSIEPTSSKAEAMKKTLRECESPAGDEERKYCTTSLESMVEFSTSILGTRQVRAVSTAVGLEGAPKQQYTVGTSRRMPGSGLVVCHAEDYPYAVFYCHATPGARAYTVEMVGADGTTLEVAAVCHPDTSWWNPRHLAFQVLKVKPGAAPVCHFLRRNQIVWAPSN